MSSQLRLEGYRECHVCSVTDKMEARQCFQCIGRLDLKDLLLLREKSVGAASGHLSCLPYSRDWVTGTRAAGISAPTSLPWPL